MAARLLYSLCLIFHLALTQGVDSADSIIFEEGYTVGTVFDGDKANLKVNPHSVQYHHGDRFIILDSVASTLYDVSLPATSEESAVQKLAGDGVTNYEDGDVASAHFARPKSFAVDHKGNVYVADQRNHAIRKITELGVTTIAGGYSKKAGRTDGHGRNASFSDDFELTFISERCALMITDRGTRLLRQINLKPEDCSKKSKSALGSTTALFLGVGLSCLLGLVVGLVIRPYVFPCDGFEALQFSWTWTHYLMKLERQVVTHCFDYKNAVVKSTAYKLFLRITMLGLSHFSLVFRVNFAQSHKPREITLSLLDLDEISSSSSSRNLTISPEVEEQLKGLLTFGGEQISPVNSNKAVEEEEEGGSSGKNAKIDDILLANLFNFEEQAPIVSSMASSSGLVKRR